MVPALNPKTLERPRPADQRGVPPNFAERSAPCEPTSLFSPPTRAVAACRHQHRPRRRKERSSPRIWQSARQVGQRVILIDGDMRRPRVHEMFNQKQEPGLSNLLVGHAVAERGDPQERRAGVWLLTAGRIPPNPAELLGSQRFKEFIELLSQHFDSMIIDSPPIMAVTDAAVAASGATGSLFVVGAEMTSRYAARDRDGPAGKRAAGVSSALFSIASTWNATPITTPDITGGSTRSTTKRPRIRRR